jgi:thiol-disulfide isomerase/thioredoxin
MTRRRYWTAIIALLSVAVLTSTAYANLTAGTRAPNFTLPILNGNTLTLADYFKSPGRVVVLDIWATWCPPCRASIPHLVGLDKKLKGKPVQFVGIAIDKDKSAVADFVGRQKIGYTIALDPDGRKIGERYDLANIPTMYIIDGNGVIRYVHAVFPTNPRTGRDDPGKIQKEIEALLARK